ncbi:MAG: UvrD-helicase domain-containing protein [Verrucomicrobiota bacterium]|nr:UvrD-helicase domain-containing protein [Verrucomicrobiota bacterium]
MSNLNPEQAQAAQHVHGPLLVLAGAGSGKTRVVTFRIAHLLEIGVDPSEILALTFTNKAADEMKERIRALKQASVLASTFHSLGARILRESISSLGFNPDFAIYDADDSDKLLKRCIEESGKKEDRFLKKARLAISTAKNDLLEPQQVQDKEMSSIFALYQKRLRECNALDFDDLLYLTVKLLKEDAKALAEYQTRWLFLLIDEYQDTNFAQNTLAKLLAAKHNNLFAVGDPDQSIYSWRGARYQNILRFEQDFPGAKVIVLNQNYRSTNYILRAANSLIRCNGERFEKDLWSELGAGQKIALFSGRRESDEAEFVAQEIWRQQKSGAFSYREMVIFYRTNAQSRAFEDRLFAYKIPYEIIGGLSFYERKEIKDLLAYLRLILSDNDLISFLRVINLPKRGLGEGTVEKIVALSQAKGIPLLPFCEELLTHHQDDLSLTAKQKKGLEQFLTIIALLRREAATLSISKVLQEAIKATNYIAYLEEDAETLQDRKENVEELVGTAVEWEERQPEAPLSQFLEELSLRSQVEKGSSIPAVTLMTLHNSKGLEFPLVFLVGMEEDLLPHINSKEDEEKVEEERRLCYVGITRARRQLYLCRSMERMLWGAWRRMTPSRFLREIPKECTTLVT